MQKLYEYDKIDGKNFISAFQRKGIFLWMNKISKNGLRLSKITLLNKAHSEVQGRNKDKVGIKKFIISQLFAYFCPRNSFWIFSFIFIMDETEAVTENCILDQKLHTNTGPNQVKFFVYKFSPCLQHLYYSAPGKSLLIVNQGHYSQTWNPHPSILYSLVLAIFLVDLHPSHHSLSYILESNCPFKPSQETNSSLLPDI